MNIYVKIFYQGDQIGETAGLNNGVTHDTVYRFLHDFYPSNPDGSFLYQVWDRHIQLGQVGPRSLLTEQIVVLDVYKTAAEVELIGKLVLNRYTEKTRIVSFSYLHPVATYSVNELNRIASLNVYAGMEAEAFDHVKDVLTTHTSNPTP